MLKPHGQNGLFGLPVTGPLYRWSLCGLLAVTHLSCASTQPPIALGEWEQFKPVYLRSGTRIELAKPAYVSIIAVREPWDLSFGPLIFDVLYPRWETDRLRFEAGRHNLVSRQRTAITPLNCHVETRPSLRGCRPALHMYPGVRSSSLQRDYPSQHVLMVASEEFIDPYELAFDLFYFALDNDDIAHLLRDGKPLEAAERIEKGILDRPGSPFWAGYLLLSK